MDLELLINIIDEHNENIILATKKYNPKEVLFLYEDKDEEVLSSLENYYKNKFNYVRVKSELIDDDNIEGIKKVINQNKNKSLLVNLTGGRRINSLILQAFCIMNNIKSIYIDYKLKHIYEIDKDIKKTLQELDDLEIDNIIDVKGGEIVNDSTDLMDKKQIRIITEYIYKNLDTWHEYKKKLYDQQIFIHDYKDSKSVLINTNFLNEKEKKLLNKVLNKLKELNGITYFEKEDKIDVMFQNDYLKSFIFKSGTWLEVITNILVKEIDEIDEVRSGVIFLWNNKEKSVKNEVDVLLVKDSVLTCISCKDSNKYNEDALNELDIYANKIGGCNANKILVSTKAPEKTSINQRAKEMGIHIVIFDGNTEKFKKEIKEIIKINK